MIPDLGTLAGRVYLTNHDRQEHHHLDYSSPPTSCAIHHHTLSGYLFILLSYLVRMPTDFKASQPHESTTDLAAGAAPENNDQDVVQFEQENEPRRSRIQIVALLVALNVSPLP